MRALGSSVFLELIEIVYWFFLFCFFFLLNIKLLRFFISFHVAVVDSLSLLNNIIIFYFGNLLELIHSSVDELIGYFAVFSV